MDEAMRVALTRMLINEFMRGHAEGARSIARAFFKTRDDLIADGWADALATQEAIGALQHLADGKIEARLPDAIVDEMTGEKHG